LFPIDAKHIVTIKEEHKQRLRTALFWVIKEQAVLISYSCFGISGFENPNFWTLRMGLIGCSTKKSPKSLHNDQGQHSSQVLCGGSLKSYIDRGCSRMGAEENGRHEKT